MGKKLVRNVLNGISMVIIVFAVFVLFKVVFTKPGQTPSILGYSVFRVMSGSMEPTLPVDTLIVVKKVEASDIRVDDIITFYSADPALKGAINTHRVVGVAAQNGFVFDTKGDANSISDKYPVMEKALIGKVVFSSLFLGKAVRLLSNPIVFIPIIIVPLAVLVVLNLIKTVRITKEMVKEEEKETARRIEAALRKRRELQEQQKKENETCPDTSEEKNEL